MAVEEQFYLVLPIVVAALSRRWLAILAVSSLVCGPLVRMALTNDVSNLAAYCWPIARVDAFGWGILLALFAHVHMVGLRQLPAYVIGSGAIILFLFYTLLFFPAYSKNALSGALYFSGLDILAAGLVLAAVAVPDASRLHDTFVHEWLRWAGDRCYSIYLFHNAILGLAMIAMERSWPGGGSMGRGMAALGGFALLLVLADIIYRRIELPFIAFGKRLRDHDKRRLISAALMAPVSDRHAGRGIARP